MRACLVPGWTSPASMPAAASSGPGDADTIDVLPGPGMKTASR